jgi:hypothetical protein
MRTTHAFLASLATMLVGAPLALTQCSGSGSSKVTGGATDGGGSHNGGSSGGGSSGGSGGQSSSGGGEDAEADGSSGGTGPSSSGAGGEGGATGEGGASSSGAAAAPVPDGGAPSTPMMVACGSTSCDTSTSQCCLAGDAGTCTAFTAGCGGITEPCDEAADCTNAVCCQPLECGMHSTTCKTSCAATTADPTTYFQLCRTDSECGATTDAGAAQKCIVQTCGTQPGLGGTCGGTMVKVEACAYPTPGFGGTTTWGPLPECTAD